MVVTRNGKTAVPIGGLPFGGRSRARGAPGRRPMRRQMRRHRIAGACTRVCPGVMLLLGLLGLAACSGGGDAASKRATVGDSAGIAIAENISPDDSAANVWWRISDATVDIGGADATEQYAVFRVVGVARTSDNRIVVLNAGSDDVRYYDAQGTWLKTSGREGGGPGEFKNPYLLLPGPADTVFVADGSNRRITIFAPDGSFVGDIPEVGSAPRILGRFADGTWLATASIRLGTDDLASVSNRLIRSDVALVRYDDGLAAGDTIMTLPGNEQVINISATNGTITSIEIHRPSFAKAPVELACGNEICSATQDNPEIRVYGQDGALHRIIRTGRQPEPVTEAMLDADFERRLAQMPEQARAQARAAGQGDQPHGDFVPPYEFMLVDRTGRFWLSDYTNPLTTPGRWTVYALDGRVLARIRLPERFRPYDIGEDWILGRELDDLDVEHVKLYPLVTAIG